MFEFDKLLFNISSSPMYVCIKPPANRHYWTNPVVISFNKIRDFSKKKKKKKFFLKVFKLPSHKNIQPSVSLNKHRGSSITLLNFSHKDLIFRQAQFLISSQRKSNIRYNKANLIFIIYINHVNVTNPFKVMLPPKSKRLHTRH